MESQKSDVSPNRLQELISQDQALTGRVLRVVNSAYYGLPSQVFSVGQACVILGVSQIRNLALSMAALDCTEIRTERDRQTHLKFWQHAFGAAASTRYISQKMGLCSSAEDLAFTAALLHDIGRMFFWLNLGEAYWSVYGRSQESGTSIELVEAEMLGTDHCAMGALMSEKWGLPSSITAIIAQHEGPLDESSEPAVMAVNIADCLNEHLYSDDVDYDLPACDPFAIAWFQPSEADWAAIMSYTADKVGAATTNYGQMAA